MATSTIRTAERHRVLLAALLMSGGFGACSNDDGAGNTANGGASSGGISAGGQTGGAVAASGAESSGKAGSNSSGAAAVVSGGSAGKSGAGGAATSDRGGAATMNGGAPSSAGRGGSAGANAPGGDAGAAGDVNGAAGAAGTDGGAGSGGKTAGLDAFGIRELYPSAPGGAEWTSEHWNKGTAYSISGRTDNNDPLKISGMRGDGTLRVTGTGELVMGGAQPRIYVYPVTEARPWRDVEVTVYYKRVEDEATAYAGLVVGVRSGEGHNDDTACDAHTYYSRLRHDGAIDFEKELKHPASSTRQRVQPTTVWPPDGKLPFDTWIGWKFVIYNLSTTSVKLESYRDLSGGVNGGEWKKMSETTDSGGWSVEDDCAAHSPQGGESDMVVVDGGFTFIRNTDAAEARYRWFSVREIAP